MLRLDTGNTGFMILCTSLVMLMTPGLAFFYGGLVGRKNVLAIMIQSFVSMGWTTVLWYLYGFSLCFSGDWHGIIGNFNNVCLRGIGLSTASPNDTIPMMVFIAYQMMFAIITPGAHFGSVYESCDVQGVHAVPNGMADFCLFSVRAYGLGRRNVAAVGREGFCRRNRGAQYRGYCGAGFGALRRQAAQPRQRTAQHSTGRAGDWAAVVWMVWI